MDSPLPSARAARTPPGRRRCAAAPRHARGPGRELAAIGGVGVGGGREIKGSITAADSITPTAHYCTQHSCAVGVVLSTAPSRISPAATAGGGAPQSTFYREKAEGAEWHAGHWRSRQGSGGGLSAPSHLVWSNGD
jgi:hypothetical protein